MPMIRRAFELTEQATGGPNQNSAAMRVQYAQAMTRAGQYEGAIAFLDAATPIIDAQLGAESDRALAARDTRLVALLGAGRGAEAERSEEHTSELQSLMRISYAVFCLKKKTTHNNQHTHTLMHTST